MGAEISTKSFDVRIREDCTREACQDIYARVEYYLGDRLRTNYTNATVPVIYYDTQFKTICTRSRCATAYGQDVLNPNPDLPIGIYRSAREGLPATGAVRGGSKNKKN